VNTINNLQWSKAEKQAARRAFDAAYERECRAIRAKLEQMLEGESDVKQKLRLSSLAGEDSVDRDVASGRRHQCGHRAGRLAYGIELLNANHQLRIEDHGSLIIVNEAIGERREIPLE